MMNRQYQYQVQCVGSGQNGAWIQYEFRLSGGYDWNFMLDSAQQLIDSSDFSVTEVLTYPAFDMAGNDETQRCRRAGFQLRQVLGSVAQGVLTVRGTSQSLGAMLQICWYDRSNTLWVFSTRDDMNGVTRLVASLCSIHSAEQSAAALQPVQEQQSAYSTPGAEMQVSQNAGAGIQVSQNAGAGAQVSQNAGAVTSKEGHAGMMAWSIVTLFLCTLPGIVAIVQTNRANKETDAKEVRAHLDTAKIWNIIGTVLGILMLIGVAAERAATIHRVNAATADLVAAMDDLEYEDDADIGEVEALDTDDADDAEEVDDEDSTSDTDGGVLDIFSAYSTLRKRWSDSDLYWDGQTVTIGPVTITLPEGYMPWGVSQLVEEGLSKEEEIIFGPEEELSAAERSMLINSAVFTDFFSTEDFGLQDTCGKFSFSYQTMLRDETIGTIEEDFSTNLSSSGASNIVCTSEETGWMDGYETYQFTLSYDYEGIAMTKLYFIVYEGGSSSSSADGILIEYEGMTEDTDSLAQAEAAFDAISLVAESPDPSTVLSQSTSLDSLWTSETEYSTPVADGDSVSYGPLSITIPESYTMEDGETEFLFCSPDSDVFVSLMFSEEDSYYVYNTPEKMEIRLSASDIESLDYYETFDINGYTAVKYTSTISLYGMEFLVSGYMIFENTDVVLTPSFDIVCYSMSDDTDAQAQMEEILASVSILD